MRVLYTRRSEFRLSYIFKNEYNIMCTVYQNAAGGRRSSNTTRSELCNVPANN